MKLKVLEDYLCKKISEPRATELVLPSTLTVITPPSSVKSSPPTSPPSGTTPTKVSSPYQHFPFEVTECQPQTFLNFPPHSYLSEKPSAPVSQVYVGPKNLKLDSQPHRSYSLSSTSSSLQSPVSPVSPASTPLCPYTNYSNTSQYQHNQSQSLHSNANSLSLISSEQPQQQQQYFPPHNYLLYNSNKNSDNKNTKSAISINNNHNDIDSDVLGADLQEIETFDFQTDINNNTCNNAGFNSANNCNTSNAPDTLPPFSFLLRQSLPKLSDVSNVYNEPCNMQEDMSDMQDMKYTELMKMDIGCHGPFTTCMLDDTMDNAAVKTEPMDPIFSEHLTFDPDYHNFPYLDSPTTESDGSQSSSAENEVGLFRHLSEVGIIEGQPQPLYRPNPEIQFNPQQYLTNGGHASPQSDEGFVEGSENLPNFAKIQHAAVEAERPQQRRRSSASSPKEKKRATRESPITIEKERRKPGRKPGQVSNVLHLWEFMRDLLHAPSNCGIIEWISKPEGVFRVVNSTEVARLWGEKKKNKKKMTYEKLSRSLRYSRLEGYFSDLPKDKNYPKKLCFKFGPKSKDWH